MSNKAQRIVIGQIVGVFGIKGWVKIKSYTQRRITDYRPWYLATSFGLKELVVDEYSERPQGLIVHIEGIDERDAALALGKARIEIDQSLLPELEENDYYWHQLTGLRVISLFESKRVDLGRVDHLVETGANDVLVIKGDKHSIDLRERLVPYVLGLYVLEVDIESGLVCVDWDPQF